ncbi:VOC family protein [Telmatospirillum sp.]|uniref:VOC family protein n=1 Tax=Telmatospirillum sp. TaxID=2079197 RepID=UPI00283D6782|nr:VOC family protein [Telmatospirillum sp.]MDR3439929.1 VOC family protein [Telmatospirillum sp.]
MEFDHIGIFVDDIERGQNTIGSFLPIVRHTEIFEDHLLRVKVQFLYDASGVCYELVAPFGEKNPVDVVLKTRKNVLNHVAYRAHDFDGTSTRLTEQGALPLGTARPAVAFGGRRVIFFFTPLNFIIELIEGETPLKIA